ncbi:thioredoxin domain-containing protein 6 isoform X2 [Hemicordylus capensis]|uniref:thioredoxin domain-containing protein 6 isoform X2 n=1 Tax=Hemicordylus capensis TaxID=884348 RepID=UPI00230459C5|nr:thioredoxin domain-containing protein 6 isoform X2 [Hemicordylus capensis]
MASRKKELTLQMVVSNQELWEEMLCSKGLIVVDVHQGWCGPCKTVVNLFRKIRNELGGDLLHFAVAEVDSIDALEKYRGKCEPTFLFYAIQDEAFPMEEESSVTGEEEGEEEEEEEEEKEKAEEGEAD